MTANSYNLYNGNIGRMVTTITNPTTRDILPLGNAYKYDQLNRLSESRSFTGLNLSTNAWNTASTYDGMYFNAFSYDANGNILKQLRKDENGADIDSLSYKYRRNTAGKLIQNRLYHVKDQVSAGTFGDDIDDMGTFFPNPDDINDDNNYVYDEEGRLVKDVQEEIEQIIWRVDGKVLKIVRPAESEKKNLIFEYDAMGNRIAKHVLTWEDVLEKSTYYLLDAQGNTMSVYERVVDNEEESVSFYQAEKHIYGSSRLGMYNDSISLLGSENSTYSMHLVEHQIGNRVYELSNHLGNVLTTISDKPLPYDDDADDETDWFLADIRTVQDYSPFGVELDGRTITKAIEICHDEVTEIETTQVDDTFGPSFDISIWSQQGTANVSVVEIIPFFVSMMEIKNPNSSLATLIGAKRYFTTGNGAHTVNFEIGLNSCFTTSFSWMPPFIILTQRPITVRILDEANVVVASGTYSTTGTYALTFNTSTVSTYSMEFQMTNAVADCSFLVDNVIISCVETVVTQHCEAVENYRYGFNGMEKDNEVKGQGNSYDFGARMLDTRLGRFFAIDPLSGRFPYQSPYVFAGNTPVVCIDKEGKSGIITIDKNSETITLTMSVALYGGSATPELAKASQDYLNNLVNTSNLKYMLNGQEYTVILDLKVEVYTELSAFNDARGGFSSSKPNGDFAKNYVRVEESNEKQKKAGDADGWVAFDYGHEQGSVSKWDNLGGNSGFIIGNDIRSDYTVLLHELMHGLFGDHKDVPNLVKSIAMNIPKNAPAANFPNISKENTITNNKGTEVLDVTKRVLNNADLNIIFTKQGYTFNENGNGVTGFNHNEGGVTKINIGNLDNNYKDSNGETNNERNSRRNN